MARNVLGSELIPCNLDPATGYLANGCCDKCGDDVAMHTICARMTSDFLKYSSARGTNLLSPDPETGFPGIKPGDFWCVTIRRWVEAYEVGFAPPVHLEATHSSVLEYVDIEVLREYAVQF